VTYDNSKKHARHSIAALLWLMSVAPAYAASAPQGFGSSLDEVVKLAQKEGKVRVLASLDPKEVGVVLDGFYKRYPGIKIEYDSTTGIESGEKIFTEALSGHTAKQVRKRRRFSRTV
jgi:hypothetical protein